MASVKLPRIVSAPFLEDGLVDWSPSDLNILKDNLDTFEYKPKAPKSQKVYPRTISLKRKVVMGWKKSVGIKLPKLDKKSVDKWMCSPHHNVCLALLKDGFPKAFIDLSHVVKEYEGISTTAVAQSKPHKEADAEMLELIAKYLSKSEDAERKKVWSDVCQARRNLSKYFYEKGEEALAETFLFDCLRAAKKVQNDGGRRLAEANGLVAEHYQLKGDLDSALLHFQIMLIMSDKKDWLNAQYRLMNAEASNYVAKVYSTMGDVQMDKGSMKEALKLYSKALKMSQKANDKLMMIKVLFKVGEMYRTRGDFQQAVTYFKQLEKLCKEVGEFNALCDTYEAMSVLCTTLGDADKARDYLKKFAYTAERHNLSEALIKASFLLGKMMFMTQQNYGVAWSNFSKSFSVSQTLGHIFLGDKVRVYCGISLAHNIFTPATRMIKSDQNEDTCALIDWKLHQSPDTIP